jgi:hypothetical protein
MGRLERHLDDEAIARVMRKRAGIREPQPSLKRRTKPPRARSTYRAARRNAVLHPEEGKPGIWNGAKTKYFPHPTVRPNQRDRALLGEPRQ